MRRNDPGSHVPGLTPRRNGTKGAARAERLDAGRSYKELVERAKAKQIRDAALPTGR
jgi:hypothetical protein